MLIQMTDIYTGMTEAGRIKGLNVMEEKIKLEKTFSETYWETYVRLHTSLSDLIRCIRQQSIPIINTKKKFKRKHAKY